MLKDAPATPNNGAATKERSPVPLIDLTAQYAQVQEAIGAAMERVVTSQRFVLGAEVEVFEEAIAELVGTRFAIGCASGTDALLLPLSILGAGGSGEVVVPAFTFFATAGAVHNAGLKPVFCDVDEATFNVDRTCLEAAWTDATIGAIPVHLFGQMAPMAEIMELANERGGWVLEDAAQAIGSSQVHEGGAKGAGAIGLAGSFSFFPTKNLGAFGDAGMITTNDADLAKALKEYRVHGGLQMYRHDVVGTNSRLDALQAAVLGAKLPFLDGWTEARRRNAAAYRDGLADVSAVRLPATLEGNDHVYNQFTVRVDERDRLREHLSACGVGTGVYYPVPLHLQKCFEELGYREGDLPVAERLCRQVVSLPVYSELSREQIDSVIDAIREFYGTA